MQVWPSLPQWFRWWKLKLPSSICSLKSLLLKNCASDKDPLDPTLTQRNLYSASTRASSTREKETIVVVIVIPKFLWLLHGDMFLFYCPYTRGTFHLVLSFSFTFFCSSGLLGQCKYLSWNSARMAWQTWGTNLQMVVRPTSQ